MQAAANTTALTSAYDANGLHYNLNDWLGTRRAQTDYAGVLEQTCSSLPFGDALNCSGGNLQSPTEQHFTGKERDTESGNDYFDARYYSSAMGRFLSPDNPKFSEKSDPQSWNLYSYVLNNPLSKTDPTGHNWFDINGQWQWHKGSDYSWTDSSGNAQSAHSDYTNLIVYQETSQNGNTTHGTVTLYGNNGGFTKDNIMAQDDVAFSGGAIENGKARASIQLGNYEINLNRGGAATNAGDMNSNLQLLPFHNGIQVITPIAIDGGATAYPEYDWGSMRAHLIPLQGQADDTYLHGKWSFFIKGVDVTHGCISTPYEHVLSTLFTLDPSGVGEGAKNGRIAVSVQGK
jgi:RHS repeat-associated protein